MVLTDYLLPKLERLVRDRHGSVPGVTHGRAKLCDQPRGGVVEDGRRLRTRERVAADGPGQGSEDLVADEGHARVAVRQLGTEE